MTSTTFALLSLAALGWGIAFGLFIGFGRHMRDMYDIQDANDINELVDNPPQER
jgi:hypothetical protein